MASTYLLQANLLLLPKPRESIHGNHLCCIRLSSPKFRAIAIPSYKFKAINCSSTSSTTAVFASNFKSQQLIITPRSNSSEQDNPNFGTTISNVFKTSKIPVVTGLIFLSMLMFGCKSAALAAPSFPSLSSFSSSISRSSSVEELASRIVCDVILYVLCFCCFMFSRWIFKAITDNKSRSVDAITDDKPSSVEPINDNKPRISLYANNATTVIMLQVVLLVTEDSNLGRDLNRIAETASRNRSSPIKILKGTIQSLLAHKKHWINGHSFVKNFEDEKQAEEYFYKLFDEEEEKEDILVVLKEDEHKKFTNPTQAVNPLLNTYMLVTLLVAGQCVPDFTLPNITNNDDLDEALQKLQSDQIKYHMKTRAVEVVSGYRTKDDPDGTSTNGKKISWYDDTGYLWWRKNWEKDLYSYL